MHGAVAATLQRLGLRPGTAPAAAQWEEFLTIASAGYGALEEERDLAERSCQFVSSQLRTLTDASERRSALLATLLDSVETGVCIAERDGTVSVANATMRETVGACPTGRNILDVLAGLAPGPGQADDPLRKLRAALHARAPVFVPHALRSAGPSIRHLSIRFVPSEPDRVVITIADITQRVEAEQQRQRMERRLEHQQRLEAIGRLAGGIAHDFNNILAGILVCTDLLDQLEGEAQEDLLEIRRSALRGADMTRRLLAFSRQDADDPEVIEVNDVLHGLLGMLSRLLGRIDLETSLVSQSCPVLMDGSDLEQVVMNLAVNARHAIDDRGRIVIETERTTIDHESTARFDLPPGDYVQLKVSDNGCGMSATMIDRAFEPFFTTRSQGVGNGLGLATVHNLVTRANGRVYVYSEVGMGTTFRILLPLAGSEALVTGARPRIASDVGMRILLLEDDAQLLHSTARIFADAGCLVTEAPNVAAARAAFAGEDFDALVADLVIDGHETGFDFAIEARATRPDLGVIMISGFSERLRWYSLRERMVYLEKPAPSAALMQALRSVVAERTGIADS